jgi:hypothetical protein
MAVRRGKTKVTAPPSFVDFVRPVITLTPAQRVLARVAFDGAEPRDLPGEEREIAGLLFGDVDEIPPEARHVVAIVAGARGGKSYLGALRLLHAAVTVPLDSLAAGERAVALCIAPDLRLARQAVRYAIGAAKALVPAMIEGETADGVTLKRADGHLVSIECLPATRGGSSVRGRSLVAALLDESAFFRDEGAVVNDQDVFRAVTPRVVPGGQVVVASTPWTEVGLLWQLSREYGRPRTCLAAHAPTSLLRPDPRTRAMVERERARDPANAEREYDAQFMRAGADSFFSAEAIDECLDEDLDAATASPAGSVVLVGADLGFRKDASACVVLRVEHGVAIVAETLELRPARGAPLVPSQVCAAFARLARKHGADRVMTDSFAIETAREHWAALGVAPLEAPAGQPGKVATYERARDLLAEGRVRLSPAHKDLRAQLLAVTARPTSGGGLSIVTPRRAGAAHGDVASALVLALWQAARHLRRSRQPYRPISRPEPDYRSAAHQFRAPERSTSGDFELEVDHATGRVRRVPARRPSNRMFNRDGRGFGGF